MSFQSSCKIIEGRGVMKSDWAVLEVERQSGNSDSPRLDWKMGHSFICHPAFSYNKKTHNYLCNHSLFPWLTHIRRFMNKTRWSWAGCWWLCLHLTLNTKNPDMFWDTWHEEIIHVICLLWIADYRLLCRLEMAFPQANISSELLILHYLLMHLLYKL